MAPAPKPASLREPSCRHAPHGQHGAGSCSTCKESPFYLDWRAAWNVYLDENPDSPEARFVRAAERCVAAQKADSAHPVGAFYPCRACELAEAVAPKEI